MCRRRRVRDAPARGERDAALVVHVTIGDVRGDFTAAGHTVDDVIAYITGHRVDDRQPAKEMS